MKFDDTKSKAVSDDCQKKLTSSFLLKTCDKIEETRINVDIQGSLIRTWLQCFAQDKYPNSIDFYLLMRSLFKMAGKGNTAFIEKYFLDSKYTFRYILSLPQVIYVKGGVVYNRHIEERKSQEKWDEICDFHFVLAAFSYYMGLKSLPKQMLTDEFGMELLPQNRQDLLLTYTRCKSKMTTDGGYNHIHAEELYGRRIDPEFIDNFAVLLFALLDDSEAYYYFLYTTKEIEDRVKGYKTLFFKIGEKYKKDAYIKTSFNKICQLNFYKAFDESKRILGSKPSKESFEKNLPDLLCSNIKIQLHNQILKLKSFKNEMWGVYKEDKNEELEFGICPIRMTKHLVEQWTVDEVYYNMYDIVEIFQNRAHYLYMKVLLSWSYDAKRVQPDSIKDIVMNIIDGHPEDFTFVDYDSHYSNWLYVDYEDFRHPKCEGVDYVSNTSINYLRDTYLYKQLEGKLFLIKKQDLPALLRTTDSDVEVTFDDRCNYESNCMDLRVNINSKFVIKYKKHVNITSFEVIPMKAE